MEFRHPGNRIIRNYGYADENGKNSRRTTLGSCSSGTADNIHAVSGHGKNTADVWPESAAKQGAELRKLRKAVDVISQVFPLPVIGVDVHGIVTRWNRAAALIMQKHSEIGYKIANSSSAIASIADLVLYHHERWDGKGYPLGLGKDNIPLIARIITIVDAYDAMTNDRPYRKGMNKGEALEEIRKCSGAQFDPYLAKVFINCMQPVVYNDAADIIHIGNWIKKAGLNVK